MIVEQTPLDGVLLITPDRYGDDRGFFAETYNVKALLAHGITRQFVQDNHSMSMQANTVRGLHFQAPPHAQAKLVRCGRGALFDVAVDIRSGSPTYGKWWGAELSFDNGCQMFIPEGFAHGFATRCAETEIVYKCSQYYAPQAEASLRFDDRDLAIDWRIEGTPILSERDRNAMVFSGWKSPFTYGDA
ncbi:dTDP-4-dehydrorhamnose 3,5-epimerase [Erythrobacter insulae]|uniref:dTDP-4-dehydrorhamnose 3,5-epimerase n=1 Tax=Erythrobacter insulae TaxID=2584124 RepID=A0A547PBA7_9SPHN|nr:dTDP-4-dehydrorhamnose 3,5-epimerase [Erythrobacter insulae]TRD11428.1 dTDP-4-dehydrorhamnose 3,5-epimerase [Erythrobacter insulae]